MPFIIGSVRPSTAFAAIAASTALPPAASTCAPALDASGWLVATMPSFVAIIERPGTTSGGVTGSRGAGRACAEAAPRGAARSSPRATT